MATGGTTSIAGAAGGTARVTVLSESCNIFAVSNRSTSTGPVYVIVNNLHVEGLPIGPGVSWPFRNGPVQGVSSVQIYGDGSNAATVDWGILAK